MTWRRDRAPAASTSPTFSVRSRSQIETRRALARRSHAVRRFDTLRDLLSAWPVGDEAIGTSTRSATTDPSLGRPPQKPAGKARPLRHTWPTKKLVKPHSDPADA